MLKRIVLCFAAILCGLALALAQPVKTTENLQQLWLAYLNQTRLSDRWGVWVDLHLRMKEDFIDGLSQSIVRLGATYYVSDATKLTVGYAYVNQFPGDNHRDISRPEHRPWQQLQWHTKYGRNRMMQWLRLEERFRRKILNNAALADRYDFNYRLRYNLLYEVPLNKKGVGPKSFSFIANDEVHINFGKQIINNYFDQNRFFLGIKYQTNTRDNLQLGYMNVFQQLAAGNRYRNINGVRIFYFHNPDLRKANSAR